MKKRLLIVAPCLKKDTFVQTPLKTRLSSSGKLLQEQQDDITLQ